MLPLPLLTRASNVRTNIRRYIVDNNNNNNDNNNNNNNNKFEEEAEVNGSIDTDDDFVQPARVYSRIRQLRFRPQKRRAG